MHLRRTDAPPTRRARHKRALLSLVAGWISSLLLFFVTSTTYAADLNGTWTASSLRVSWSIGDWGNACGPRPSGGGESGGTVTLTQTGSDFKLSGLGRSYSSNQCWEQMPGLSARSHSAGSSAIQTTCKMPAGDPRQATVVTTWSPRGDKLYFDETGQYQFVLKGSNCTASVRRTRVLSRVVEKAAPEPVATRETAAKSVAPAPSAKPVVKKQSPPTAPPPPPARASQCKSAGRAVSLEISPKTKLMRPGESFEFQVIARDKDGCRAAVNTKWEFLSGSGGTLSQTGKLTVPAQAATGTLTLQASVEDKSVKVTARIVTDEEYEALIAGGEYGVMGESLDAASVTLSTAHVEFDAETATEEDSSRRTLLLLLVGLVLLLAGTAAFLLSRKGAARKGKRTHTEAPREAIAQEAPPPPTPAGSATATTSVGVASPAAVSPTATNPDAVTSPAAVTSTPEVKKPARLCPVCGKRYEDDTMFCGEDGARLVRSN